jgi:YD repeat-containing protein
VLAAFTAGAAGRVLANDIFDATGFDRKRETFTQLPYEHIDPMTGNLILTFTDLVLPGNAGFDLKIQRTYNSKIYLDYDTYGGSRLGEDAWVGVGWTMHLGRVLNPFAQSGAPIIEMSDGSRHKTYTYILESGKFVTRDFWIYDRNANPPTLKLPNGVVYTLGQQVSLPVSGTMLYTTRIEDPFGNRVEVSYATPSEVVPDDGIDRIRQYFGTTYREIVFGYVVPNSPNEDKNLRTMTFAGSKWTYYYDGISDAGYSTLKEVRPPVGPSWQYTYRPATDTEFRHALETVTTPQGGVIKYVYDTVDFYLGTTVPITSAVVHSRQTLGHEIPDATWTYEYAQSTQQNQTVITSPACSGSGPTTTTYTFAGIGTTSAPNAWRVGLQLSRELIENGVQLEMETLTWRASDPISNDPEHIGPAGDPKIFVPLVATRTVSRDGLNYQTVNTYGPGNFSDYGRPYHVAETGQLARTTQRVFTYAFDPNVYIRDRVESETVTVNGESFTKSYAYASNTGFMTSQTIYGITTSYTPHTSGNALGNVDAETNARQERTEYDYEWGVPSSIKTPEYTITRSVNLDGTIAWEKRRGATTTYAYDDLFRLTDIIPPTTSIPPSQAPYPWKRVFDANGRGFEVRRGASPSISVRRTNLDGFGRPSSTRNSVNIETDTQYDACGRVQFETHPFLNPPGSPNDGSGVRTTFEYDGLGRLTEKTSPDPLAFVTYTYTGIKVDIRDENGRITTQRWEAFGDPGDARLQSVQDAGSGGGGARTTTSYTYNALGSLTGVSQPGAVRSWEYFEGRNQLRSETHPESGRVDYTYDEVGNVRTRTDQEFGLTRFTYDGNNRLLHIDRPGGAHDVVQRWDDSDNRTFVSNASVVSDFVYDAANRLTSREDRINGLQAAAPFVTTYVPDRKDNVGELHYPSGTRVTYTYDEENRLKTVAGAGRTLAHTLSYHPSGGIEKYTAGNGRIHETGYDPKRYWPKSVTVDGQVLVAYTEFDRVGNVQMVSDSRLGEIDPVYDPVDRMTSANATSAWGVASFTYDSQGNRQTSRVGSGITNYIPDTAHNRLAALSGAQTATFFYDDNGNTVSDGSGTYTYTPANMLASAVVNGSRTDYRYDGDNLRKLKLGATSVSVYLHGPGDQILSELQGTAASVAPVRDYVYAGTRLVAAVKPPVLVTSSESLTFAVVVGSPAPPTQTIGITEANGAGLTWTAAESVSWLGLVPPTSGTTPSTLRVSVNPASLQVGSYVGAITIDAPGAVGSPKPVRVRLVVTNEPGLVVSPSNLEFRTFAGFSAIAPQDLELLNSSGGSASWSIVPSASWIQVSPASGGTMPTRVSVSVDNDGLTEGTYRGYLTVTANGLPGSPRHVPVHMTVEAGPGVECPPEAWYCEPFDGLGEGDISGQAGWNSTGSVPGQVIPDPRGLGQALLLDPYEGAQINDDVGFADHPVDGTEVSVQLMTQDVPADSKQAAKIEFFTTPGTAWGKTFRTFGALRFGSVLYFQYGPNIYQVLVDSVQSGRWYSVTVKYQGQRIDVSVDGVLKYSTVNPLAPAAPFQGFGTTGWEVPGAAYIDMLQARPLPTGLVVQPQELKFHRPAGSGLARKEGPAPVQTAGAEEARTQAPSPSSTAKTGAPRTAADVRAQLVQQPLAFEENRGQAPSPVRYLARGLGHTLFLTNGGLVIQADSAAVRMALDGSSPSPRIEALDPLPGKSNYLVGDRRSWVTNVPRFAKVAYRGLYPGVDLVVYGKEGELEYDLVVAPGADPSRIRLSFTGADEMRVDQAGHLVLETPGGEVRQLKPHVYQQREGSRHRVAGGYALEGSTVTIQVADYDRTQPLVIDPVISYSTYLEAPSDGLDIGYGVAVDPDGNAYVAGSTRGQNFPTVNALQPTKGNPQGVEQAFVVKLDSAGTVIYSTFLGGNTGRSVAYAIAADAAGHAYVAGYTTSLDFPLASPVQDEIGQGNPLQDAFLSKLSPTGSGLDFSTYVGGDRGEWATDVALDAAGNIYIAGYTSSATLMEVTAPKLKRINLDIGPPVLNGIDVYVAKFGAIGHDVGYLTYLNGFGNDLYPSIAVDGVGAVFVTGTTVSPPHAEPERNPFPASIAALRRIQQEEEAFLTKLNGAGDAVLFSTYLGGVSKDYGNDVAIQPGCSVDCPAYVAGATFSQDFPTTAGAPWPSHPSPGLSGGFVTKVDPNGASLEYLTYEGGVFDSSIAVDAAGFAYVGGQGNAVSYNEALCGGVKVTAGPVSVQDAHLVKLNPAGTGLDYCVFVGSSSPDSTNALAIDGLGALYLTGVAGGINFYTTPGAFQRAEPGRDRGAFYTKISESADDVARVQLDATAYEVHEDVGRAVVVATRTGNLNETVSVTYATRGCRRRNNCPHTAQADEGFDFVLTSGTLRFGPDETALAFTVPIIDDSAAEPAEWFTATLQAVTEGTAVLGFPTQARVTIHDNDGPTRTFVVKDRVLASGPNWEAEENIPWLMLSQTSGVGPTTVTATVSTANLSPGTYEGTIVITGDTGDSPQFIEVTLTVTP